MNVVFYYIGERYPDHAQYCIKSIRKHMDAHIIQLTDRTTPAIDGVDEVRRHDPKHDMVHYNGYQFLSEMDEDEVLYTDLDMMYCGNLDHLFCGDAEVTAATRSSRDRVSHSYKQRYPYCSMMVVRNRKFWKDCYDRLLRMRKPSALNNMEAVASIIDGWEYRIKILDGDIYNALPKSHNERVMVYHFKGYKHMMKKFWERHIDAKV